MGIDQGGAQGEIKLEKKGKVVFFRLYGAIEIMRSLELEEMIKNTIGDEEPRLVFDMSGVTHLSSSGIRVLLATLRHITEIGGKLVLCNLSIVVRKMVETIELDQLFDIYDDCEKAFKSLNK